MELLFSIEQMRLQINKNSSIDTGELGEMTGCPQRNEYPGAVPWLP
jgi:hypothetical protein